MHDDILLSEDAQTNVDNAEKVMPAVESTGKVVKNEMAKLTDQIVQSMPEVGSFARVFGEDEGRFVILNEPVVISDAPVGTDGQPRKGIVIITPDGFKVYLRNPSNVIMKTDDDLIMLPNLVSEAEVKGDVRRYQSIDGKPFIVNQKNSSQRLELFESADDNVPLKAISASISKAQEGPKQTIAKNQATIKAAGAVQSVVTQAAIGK